jgi:hypothetical protein
VRPLFPQEQAKGATSVVRVAEDCSSLQVGLLVCAGPGRQSRASTRVSCQRLSMPARAPRP